MCIKNKEYYALCNDHVCIEDMSGRLSHGGHIEYWADYCTATHRVVFGGAWYDVPDMTNIETLPNSETAHNWARAHDGFWFQDAARYLAAIEAL